MKFIVEIEMELPTDDEGLTDDGWEIYYGFDKAMNALRDDYRHDYIERVGMPKRKATNSN